MKVKFTISLITRYFPFAKINQRHQARDTLSLKYSHTKNSISLEQPEIATANNTITYRSHNLKYLRSWGISTGFPLVIAPWWEMQNDVSAFHQSYETSYLETDISHEAISINVNTSSSFILPRNFFIELSGSYQSKELWGIWEFELMGQLNVGVKKKFAGDHSTLTLTLTERWGTCRVGLTEALTYPKALPVTGDTGL